MSDDPPRFGGPTGAVGDLAADAILDLAAARRAILSSASATLVCVLTERREELDRLGAYLLADPDLLAAVRAAAAAALGCSTDPAGRGVLADLADRLARLRPLPH